MKKKLLSVLSFILMFLFASLLSAQAIVTSQNDMKVTVDKLNNLARTDFISFVNKNELVGYRLNSYQMATESYRRNVYDAIERFNTGIDKIDLVNNSTDFSDTEKEMQINQILHEGDMTISDLNSKTISYLISLKGFMPSVTYQRYLKKFQTYYNSLNLINNKLSVW